MKNKKIFIAGHKGLVGSAIYRELVRLGYTTIITKSRAELDLLDACAVEDFFAKEQPEWVFLSAAKVGGIYGNNTYPVEFMLENLTIQNAIIQNAHKYGVQKLLFLGSSCIYPKNTPQPIREEYLLSGVLEKTNEAYALAKICGIKLCDSYNREYGTNFLSVMPCNLYGINDNYDAENGHAFPMLLRRFHEAVQRGDTEVTLWGTGKPKREFMCSDDLANACVWLMEHKNASDIGEFINLGVGTDITILALAEMIQKLVGFTGTIVYDTTKPDGVMQKCMDIGRMRALGWEASISLEEGLTRTYQDFLSNTSFREK